MHFAFRSPYSWLALRRLEELVPDAPDRVDLVPFWEPGGSLLAELTARGAGQHYQPMSKAKHLYLLTDTKRLARELGYEMRWPLDLEPDWDLSHLAWVLARREGLARPFYRAVVQARWERGEDISDPAVIRRAAGSVGLDPTAAVEAGADPQVRAEGLQALVDAYEDDIFGIPYFRIGFHRFWGLDRLDAFVRVLTGGAAAAPVPDALGAGPPRAPAEAAAGYDRDTAGGCG